MVSLSEKLAILCKIKNMFQTELSNKLSTWASIITCYERDKMISSINAAKKMSDILDTTLGLLLVELQENTFKAPVLHKRLKQINNLLEVDKHCIVYTIDNLLASAFTKLANAK